jgi:hypothetical protein
VREASELYAQALEVADEASLQTLELAGSVPTSPIGAGRSGMPPEYALGPGAASAGAGIAADVFEADARARANRPNIPDSQRVRPWAAAGAEAKVVAKERAVYQADVRGNDRRAADRAMERTDAGIIQASARALDGDAESTGLGDHASGDDRHEEGKDDSPIHHQGNGALDLIAQD